jgi:branched-chain amino acid transport system permease protein
MSWDFWSTILVSASIASIAAIGLFLQIRSGQLNVGMAVFVGVGGFVSGALGVHYVLPPIASIPIAIVAGFIFGTIFSFVTLRLHHWFFAVTTLALSLAAVSAIGTIPFFGGPLGLAGIPFLTSPAPIVLLLLATLAVAYAIDRSRIGLAVRATGNDQMLAEIFGVRVRLLRIVIFGVGSAMAALSGALHAHRFGVYQPSDLGFHYSLLLFVYVIIGGKGHILGPVLGTFFLFVTPEVLAVPAELQLLLYGSLMVLVSVFMPGGIMGGITHFTQSYRNRSRPKRNVSTQSAGNARA